MTPPAWQVVVVVRVYIIKKEERIFPRSSHGKRTANGEERQQHKRFMNLVQQAMRKQRKDS